mmetsp:Transcript_38249/g.36605  ORF Transcript_38249/g.36605 Transcript_38249/m.36605 type:complete len:138 (+) Transcript_38249:182-595(+)
MTDQMKVGITFNQYHDIRQFLDYSYIFQFPSLHINRQALVERPVDWEFNYNFEMDHKESKFLSRERAHVVTLGPRESSWSLKLESITRKNIIDKYSSREYIKNETLPTHKYSAALQYQYMSDSFYNIVSTELAFPFL